MTKTHLAIVVYGLTENWLGGVNYYRNLVSVFDDAHHLQPDLHLHLLTDDASFFVDWRGSSHVSVHALAMLRSRSPAWAVRKLLAKLTRQDGLLVSALKRLQARAAVFCHVPGATQAGIRCLPWIPDFQSRHHPELFEPQVVAAEHARAQVWLQQSDGLIVSSEAARRDATQFYGVADERLHVLHFAPRLDFARLASLSLRDEVFSRYGIDRPYVFLPNQYWKHKNHGLVVEALARIQQQGLVPPLVISTGKMEDMRNATYFTSFDEALRVAGVTEHYRMLGVIPRQDMLVLMAHAMAVLNPSRFEGWSSTVEEAKALGKPLLVSQIPVHLEQVQHLDNAKTFGVDDAQALAALLTAMQTEPGTAVEHPPSPQPQIYKAFARQYMALLKGLCDQPSVPA